MKKLLFTRPLSSAFAALVAFATLASVAQAQTLHLIAVGNPEGFANSENAQEDVKQDLLNVRYFFQGHVPEDRLNCVFLEKEATPYVVKAKIAKLPVEPDDVVVFYYTGHAGNETEGTGHAFQLFEEVEVEKDGKKETKLHETRLARKDVRNALAQRAPRLFVVLSDCCNAYMDALPPAANDGKFKIADDAAPTQDAETDGAKEVSPIARTLFFEPSGCVDITSSKFGQYSFTDGAEVRGSLATNAWLTVFKNVDETLKNDPEAPVDWRRVSEQMIAETEKRFQAKYPDGDPTFGQTTQTPHVFELPGATRLGARVQTRQNGVVVTEIVADSPASRAGLKIGDRLLAIRDPAADADKRLVDETDYVETIDRASRDVKITVERTSGEKSVTSILAVELAGAPSQKTKKVAVLAKPTKPETANDSDATQSQAQ
ncbi:MAG: PDZ domain-containing protein, partial [Thermoguttaceae bacterium]|nr:PDZ domain-containing protein [Thermoguttaceae bacterium]